MPPTGRVMIAGCLQLGQGVPEEVAPLALLLASQAGRYVNGRAIAVDGNFQIACEAQLMKRQNRHQS
jgi:NAD(P)-dependent dehydrogenase (short-subunit alcohol dehydrogenase family)